MNGRVYDPFLARMISADPTVPGPFNGQAFNRYSYVLNSPLSLTDPSGFSPAVGICGGTPRCFPAADGAGGHDFGTLYPVEVCPGLSSGMCGSAWQYQPMPSDEITTTSGGVVLGSMFGTFGYDTGGEVNNLDQTYPFATWARMSGGSYASGHTTAVQTLSATNGLLAAISRLGDLMSLTNLDYGWNFSFGIADSVNIGGNTIIVSLGVSVGGDGIDFGGLLFSSEDSNGALGNLEYIKGLIVSNSFGLYATNDSLQNWISGSDALAVSGTAFSAGGTAVSNDRGAVFSMAGPAVGAGVSATTVSVSGWSAQSMITYTLCMTSPDCF